MKSVPALGLRVANDLVVSLYADAALAENSFSSVIDAKGRVVVSGPGYIRRLVDSDGDGTADRFTTLTSPRTGAMGMCFDGAELVYMADGGLWRVIDLDDDGVGDQPPEKLLSVASGEHGGHAIRKGPDGWWWFLGGNDSKFGPEHTQGLRQPLIRSPEGGAMLRISPDFQTRGFVAQGFRNPYDFVFDQHGRAFTFDSDVEREYLLPWYVPTRVYEVALGGHHGWRLPGFQRSWKWPGSYPEVAEARIHLGRSSPTGVAIYRHRALPAAYHNGLFLLDWTFGKVWFCGSTNGGFSTPQVIIEPIGSEGFAPNDISVGPDGDLFISIGGRKTRGAVYRVATAARVASKPGPEDPLLAALDAPQPLEAWSRARWIPIARQLGKERILSAAGDEKLREEQRVRALEIHRELFGPVTLAFFDRANLAPAVLARALWAAPASATNILFASCASDNPLVARAALERLLEFAFANMPAPFNAAAIPHLVAALGSQDKTVSMAALAVVAYLDDAAFRRFWESLTPNQERARIRAALAAISRGINSQQATDVALQTLANSRDPQTQLEALRCVIALGGNWNIQKPSVEIYSGYELATPDALSPATKHTALEAVSELIPNSSAALQLEATRLAAMLESDAPGTLLKVAGLLGTSSSTVEEDFHLLIVVSKLRAAWPDPIVQKVADAMLGLDAKVGGRENRIKQTWTTRRDELFKALLQREPRLAPALLPNADFVKPAHTQLALDLPAEFRMKAASKFYEAINQNANWPWNSATVELLSDLPSSRPLFKQQVNNVALRDSLVIALSREPEEADRDFLLTGLGTSNPQAARASLRALRKLPTINSPATRQALARALKRAKTSETEWIDSLLSFAEATTGKQFRGADRSARVRAALTTLQPAGEKYVSVAALLSSAPWSDGNAEAGQRVFQERACASCHVGPGAIGPDLAGVTGRFSREDLFKSIIDPDDAAPEGYQAHSFETKSGESHLGLIAFEAADGVILQTGPGATLRIPTEEIAARALSEKSLMPAGLLDGLTGRDLADLYAYMQTLRR